MNSRPVGPSLFVSKQGPACFTPSQIIPQTSGRSIPRSIDCPPGGSERHATPRLCNGSGCHGRSRKWVVRAGKDRKEYSGSDKETVLFLLDSLEDAVRAMRDFVDWLDPGDTDISKGMARDFTKFLRKPSQEASQYFPKALEKIREAKAKVVAGEIMDFNELADELQTVGPSYTSFDVWIRGMGYVLGVFGYAWFFSLFGVDGWSRWNLPGAGPWVWAQWTAPHVLVSLLFWQDFLLDKITPLKAYKLAQANSLEEDLTQNFLSAASSFDLAIESFFLSLKLVFRDQGCYLNSISMGLAAPVTNEGIQSAMGGLATQKTLPKVFRAPLEIGAMGLLGATSSILSDATISPLSVSVDSREAGTPTPLRQARSIEDIRLLTTQEITKYRAWITASIFFFQGIYLTAETISTNSLIAPLATNAISTFICLKAVQKLKSNPQDINAEESS